MKRFLAAFVCLSAGLLAAQELWSGRADSVQIQGKDITDPQIAVSDDGTLTVSGRNRGSARYFYLTAVIRTAPFSLKDKSFSFTFAPTDSIKGDTVYIKGVAAGLTKDKDGKNTRKTVFSFVAYMPKAGTYVVTPGKDCPPFKWLAQQANWTTDDPIVKLELFQGRKEKNLPMGITFKDFKVVD